MDIRLKCTDSLQIIPVTYRNPVRIQHPESDVVQQNDRPPVKVVAVSNDNEGVGDSVDDFASSPEYCGRERLQRHRTEVAGQVWIPEIWGQEELLKDWIDCSAIDNSLVPAGIISARAALVDDCRKAGSCSAFPIDLQAI